MDFRPEVRVELDFLLSVKDESFKYCLSDGDSFGGLPGLAQLLGVPFSQCLVIIFELKFWKLLVFFFVTYFVLLTAILIK